MIDFRNVQTLKCDLIRDRQATKEEATSVLESKCLQLSNEAREGLRDKLSFFYGRAGEVDVEG